MEAFRSVIAFLAFASIGITTVEAYLTINKLWKHKHEKSVAESISITAKAFGLIPLSLFALNFLLTSQWQGLINYSIWIFGALIHIVVATGFFVRSGSKQGFLKLMFKSFKQESGEFGYLAKSLMLPASAELVARILVQVALIDGHLDARERVFVERFMEYWGIRKSWNADLVLSESDKDGFVNLRNNVCTYISTSPPHKQAVDLAQIINELIAVDAKVSNSERLIGLEVTNMLLDYAGKIDGLEKLNVLVVPQDKDQGFAISEVCSLERIALGNGTAFISGPYYSLDYARLVRNQYLELRFFALVVAEHHLDNISYAGLDDSLS